MHIPICTPFTLIADTRDESGEDWGRVFEWEDRDGKVKRRRSAPALRDRESPPDGEPGAP
jgi:hypothetical protein